MDKKRAVILYRMSTDRQDLETQKRMNRNFCKEKGFEIIDEFSEDGISGYKNSLDKRPDLVSILNKAEKREFDVFVVYIFDRIVRREEEYPLIVNHLTKNGVEIWASSTKEKIKVEHTDKLTNYITGWNNEYESIKTSIRVKDAIRSKNEVGKYTGGTAPLGYELYKTNEVNSKGRIIHEMRINEKEAEMVRLIFDMYNNYNYGTHTVALKLMELGYTSRHNKPIRDSVVSRALRNTIYIGRRIFNKTITGRDESQVNSRDEWKTQPYNPELRIVDDETFYKAMEKLDSRGSKYPKYSAVPRNSRQLFSGLVYCGYCGKKLDVTYSKKTITLKTTGEKKTQKFSAFRCPAKIQKTTDVHHGQVGYGTVKYQKAILDIVYKFVKQVNKDSFFSEVKKYQETNVVDYQKQIDELSKQSSNIIKIVQKLEEQIDDAIINDDIDKVDILTRRIKTNEMKAQDIKSQINKLQDQLNTNVGESDQLLEAYKELDNWVEKFEGAEDGEKKAMVMRIIDKIYFSKNEVEVLFKIQIKNNAIPFTPSGSNGSNSEIFKVFNQCVYTSLPDGNDEQTRDSNYIYITIKDSVA